MGTLDDAIREHLELKKRSGAPDEEVERLEHEAFGPVRREAPAPAAAEPEDAPDPAAEEPAVAVPFEPADPEPEPVAPDPVAEAEVPAAPPDPSPPATREPEAWLEDDDLEDGPQATAEFSAAEVEEAQGKPQSDYVAPDEEGEDLLEETPDFLQETPEHDRLWFEQRPPRDFNFDD
jgi:hypothetical protein